MDRLAPGTSVPAAASQAGQQLVDAAGEDLPLLDAQSLQRFLDGQAPRLPNAICRGFAGRGEADGDGAPVAAGALANYIAVRHQPIDQAHRRRVGEADSVTQLLDGCVVQELAQGHQRRRGLSPAANGPRRGLGHAVVRRQHQRTGAVGQRLVRQIFRARFRSWLPSRAERRSAQSP